MYQQGCADRSSSAMNGRRANSRSAASLDNLVWVCVPGLEDAFTKLLNRTWGDNLHALERQWRIANDIEPIRIVIKLNLLFIGMSLRHACSAVFSGIKSADTVYKARFLHPDSFPIICHKCCSFGHWKQGCPGPMLCSFCAGQHLHWDCSATGPKCANCGGPHPVVERSCPAPSARSHWTRAYNKYLETKDFLSSQPLAKDYLAYFEKAPPSSFIFDPLPLTPHQISLQGPLPPLPPFDHELESSFLREVTPHGHRNVQISGLQGPASLSNQHIEVPRIEGSTRLSNQDVRAFGVQGSASLSNQDFRVPGVEGSTSFSNQDVRVFRFEGPASLSNQDVRFFGVQGLSSFSDQDVRAFGVQAWSSLSNHNIPGFAVEGFPRAAQPDPSSLSGQFLQEPNREGGEFTDFDSCSPEQESSQLRIVTGLRGPAPLMSSIPPWSPSPSSSSSEFLGLSPPREGEYDQVWTSPQLAGLAPMACLQYCSRSPPERDSPLDRGSSKLSGPVPSMSDNLSPAPPRSRRDRPADKSSRSTTPCPKPRSSRTTAKESRSASSWRRKDVISTPSLSAAKGKGADRASSASSRLASSPSRSSSPTRGRSADPTPSVPSDLLSTPQKRGRGRPRKSDQKAPQTPLEKSQHTLTAYLKRNTTPGVSNRQASGSRQEPSGEPGPSVPSSPPPSLTSNTQSPNASPST
ncbi:hypothetical protein QBC41DRAFT_313492 [Cercophora samala]|uniref:CCHC-type domain-containing protein n=1 Tax=Cercophora samala TaxID=330535 RepID=A0AA39ZKD3_9PEZI|nr:hypothetical protein QBC41DRAFT_313492 [Cercophora samala]